MDLTELPGRQVPLSAKVLVPVVWSGSGAATGSARGSAAARGAGGRRAATGAAEEVAEESPELALGHGEQGGKEEERQGELHGGGWLGLDLKQVFKS